MAATFTPASVSAARPLTARERTRATWRNLALWTLQGWLAMFFIAAGYGKLTEPMGNLIALMGWPALASENFVRGLGLVELVLALGVLAPLVSWRIGRPVLIVSAGGLLALETVMLGVHLLGADWGLAVVNVLLLAITAPVAWLRRA
ncbi:MAG: DoxX family protein [Brevundimonas sp.]|nr:MAG: DoxX family protein [Brevundimonas sp.]